MKQWNLKKRLNVFHNHKFENLQFNLHGIEPSSSLQIFLRSCCLIQEKNRHLVLNTFSDFTYFPLKLYVTFYLTLFHRPVFSFAIVFPLYLQFVSNSIDHCFHSSHCHKSWKKETDLITKLVQDNVAGLSASSMHKAYIHMYRRIKGQRLQKHINFSQIECFVLPA